MVTAIAEPPSLDRVRDQRGTRTVTKAAGAAEVVPGRRRREQSRTTTLGEVATGGVPRGTVAPEERRPVDDTPEVAAAAVVATRGAAG